MEVGADQNFHTSCTPVLRNLHGQLVLRFNSPASNSATNFSHFCMVLTSPSSLITSCKGNGDEIRKLTMHVWISSGKYQTCWIRHHWSRDTSSFCSVPDYSGSTPGTLLYLATSQCLCLVNTTSMLLPPLGFPPGPLHQNTCPHTCWTVGELCGGRALPPTLPTDSGDLSPSRLRWPCPQNFCTTRSPFHIIPCFTHRGQGSLFFGIRGETYCLNTHFLKPIS